LPPGVLENVTDWQSLIQSFCKNNIITIYDVDWLKHLAKMVVECPEAIQFIDKYGEDTQNYLLVGIIPWKRCFNGSNNGTIQTITNKLPQNVTYQHIDQSKCATVELLQCNNTDLLPNTATVGSVSYNWKIFIGFGLTIKLPKSISQKLKTCCDNLGITQIIISTGDRKEAIIINQLLVKTDTSVIVVNDESASYQMSESSSSKYCLAELLKCILLYHTVQ